MRKQEIGSEFHIDYVQLNNTIAESNIFSYLEQYNAFYFDSGRSALCALLEHFEFQKVLLPDYICESVRNCFPHGEVIYYHVNDDFQIDWEDLLNKCMLEIDILYLHYFNGYIGKEYDFNKLTKIKQEKKFLIVEDTTHSFLSAVQTVGDYCVCSLRKWFPIPNGGVLYSKQILHLGEHSENQWAEKKEKAMIRKGYYLAGKDVNKKDFLVAFAESEQMLDNQKQSYAISRKSLDILKQIDLKAVSEIRCKNYEILNQKLSYKQVAWGGINQAPFFFTISVEQRDSLRKFLIDNHIYCPVHWPLYEELKTIKGAISNYEKELSIPIDQRYGLEDMLYIADKISEYAESKAKCKET